MTAPDRPADASSARPAPDRFLVAIVGGAVALIVAGVAAVAVFGSAPTPITADPQSPVGVVQAYVQAVRSGDPAEARRYLSQEAREELARTRDDFKGGFVDRVVNAEQRVLMEPVSESAERAEVKVTISAFSARSEPFSTATWHREIVVHLVRENGAWRISQPIDPYVFAY